MMSNAPNASGLSGISQPPAIAASTRPSRRSPERLAERDGPRRARVGGRQDRPADVEGDAEVGRRRAAEDGQGQVGRDLADAPLEVALVLLLGVGDPAERRAEVDPDPLRVRRAAARPASDPASSSASRPATRPNWLNRSSWRAVLGGIQASGSKSSTCAATCERNGGRIEAVDPARPASGRPAARPGTRRAGADRGDDADPGDPDPASVGHADRSVSARVGRRSSASASARALNVRQRPAGDRPGEGAVDERRERRDARPEVVVDRHATAAARAARSARSRPSRASPRRRGRTAAGASPARSRSGSAR